MDCVQNKEGQHKRTPRQAALHSLLTLQQRIKSPLQERLFLRCDWIAAKLNMSPTDRAALQWLAHCGYSNTADLTYVTQIRLSTFIGISTKSISRTVDKLADLGIIYKRPQAIRERGGRCLYGAMQNEFTEAFKRLVECSDLSAVSVVEQPGKISDFIVDHSAKPEDKTTMPSSLSELQWLSDLLGSKYLVFKIMKLAKPHLRARGLTDLNHLLCTYREPLENGYFQNPGAFLITSMMRKTFRDFTQLFDNDAQLEQAKRHIRQEKEAAEISQKFTEQGHQLLATLEPDQEHHFFDPSTLQSYKYKQGRAQARAQGTSIWKDYSLDQLAWKIGSRQIKIERRTASEADHSFDHSARQILHNMSATLKRTKSFKTEVGQTEPATPPDDPNSTESRGPSICNTEKHIKASIDAISEMRKLLRMTTKVQKLGL